MLVCSRCLANIPEAANFCDRCGMRVRAPEAIYPQYYLPVAPSPLPAVDIQLVQEAFTYLSTWWAQLSIEERLFILYLIGEIAKSTRGAVKQLREWLDRRKPVGPYIR